MDTATWQRVSSIVGRALELPEQERRQWVAEACQDNKMLLAEVETMLAVKSGSVGSLDGPYSRKSAEAAGNMTGELPVGHRVGPYEVRGELGRGGMGIVYRGWDPRLDRDVALKLLPPELTENEQARLRLLAEARAASALDHPNICTVYDIGKTQDGLLYVAMACYNGQTLAARIGDGLSLEEALKITAGLLRGLEHAHAAGVVHRDIKPSNVFLTTRGEVKILDFGLARRGVSRLTDPNARMGTLAYMSPEQVLGREVDARTDLWAAGVTLYQMLCGKLPFTEAHEAALLYAIAHEDPTPLPDAVPDHVQQVVEHLLCKRPEDRCESAAAALRALEESTATVELEGSAEAPAPVERRVPRAPFVALAFAVTGLLLFALWPKREPLAIPGKPRPLTSFAGREERPAISPDGSRVAFSWNSPPLNNYDIYMQTIGAIAPTRLTEDASWESSPVWSPGGNAIAFLREIGDEQGEIWVVDTDGGAPRHVANVRAPARAGLSWSPDGRFLAAPDRVGERGQPLVALVDVATGRKESLALSPPGAAEVRFPVYSPDGKSVAFHAIRAERLGAIYVARVEGGALRKVAETPAHPEGLAWVAGVNVLLYSLSSPDAQRSVWYSTLDGDTHEIAVSENVSEPAVSANGDRLIFSRKLSLYDIMRVGLDPPGDTAQPFIASTRFDGNPQYSPDGSQILFSSSRSGVVEIWICDADGQRPRRLTDLGVAGSPRWSPSGDQVAFDSTYQGNSEIYVVSAEGGQPRRLTRDPASDYVPTWSNDGEWVYFASDRSGGPQLWKTRADGTGDPVAVTDGPGLYAHESRDGKWIYFSKPRSRESAVWRMPMAGGPQTLEVPGISAGWTYWMLGEAGIYYVDEASGADGAEAWAVYLRRFGAKVSEKLANLTGSPTAGAPGFSVSPDGRYALAGQVSLEADLIVVDGGLKPQPPP